jgi:alpha-1,2-rhamnosyltransferase
MDLSTRIAAYLATEQYKDERFHSAYDIDPVTRHVYAKAKEFYWTVTRLTGRAGGRVASQRAGAPILVACEAQQRPRVLIDMTATRRCGERTGIQRVVREIAKWAVAAGEGLPVLIEDGRLRSYYRHPSLPETVEPAPGDKFLMLDASFAFVDEYLPIMRRIAASGGENVLGLHDILPLLYPGAFTGGAFLEFQRWFETLVPESDAIVCVSRSTAQSVVDYLAQHDYPLDPGRRIGWWSLGADLEPDGGRPSRRAIAIASTRAPFFLGVGTVEPRKGYPVALDAFERLWAAGLDARYVIVGRRGWRSEALEKRIRAHEEIDRRLFWIDDADDASLRHLYERAHGLIAASFAEGFGLPLAEAAFHGLPAIASDIPIFREIAGERATFFPPLDAEALCAAIRNALKRRGPRAPARIVTWRESTQTLLGMVRAGAYQGCAARGGDARAFEPVRLPSAAAS